MTTPAPNAPQLTPTSLQSDARAASPAPDAARASAPSNDGSDGATPVDRLCNDAPVMALIAKLHAGTTLADRVRRMRGRREGQRLHRAKKATPIKTTLGEEVLADAKRQQPTTPPICKSETLSLNLKL